MTKQPVKRIPFYFDLTEAEPKVAVTKRAILSKQIEIEENKCRSAKVKYIKKEIVEKKQMQRDYRETMMHLDNQRLESEKERRERTIASHQDKYFDPEAFEDPYL